MKYNFYYDETEHSREIGFDTISASNFYDNFVTAIVGWDEGKESEIQQKYLAFEEKYNYRKANGELKSTSISNKHLEHGFASCNKECTSFLLDFLALFSDDIRLYFSSMSKMEYLINQVFSEYHNSLLIDIDSFKYSIIKALVINKPVEVKKAIYSNPEQFVYEIKYFLMKKIELGKQNAQLKEREIEAFSEALIILDDVKLPKNLSWDYRPSFVGFKKYIDENSIIDYSLITDREGTEQKTLLAAQDSGLKDVSEASSIDVCGIRMADMLTGLIAKMMKSLCKALHPVDPDSVSKTILPRQWFMVNENQLKLYKQFYYVLCKLNNSWYKSFCGIYSDDVISLIALLGFMNHFSSVDEIKKDINMQGEYYNSYACQSLEDNYSRMRNKLPIEYVSQENVEEGYFYNQRGAKCFFDTNKQPMLPLTNGENCYYVLSVGFDRERIPLATVEQNGQAYCYRLPNELSGWAFSAVGMANMGEKVFPSKVLFTNKDGKIYVDIL